MLEIQDLVLMLSLSLSLSLSLDLFASVLIFVSTVFSSPCLNVIPSSKTIWRERKRGSRAEGGKKGGGGTMTAVCRCRKTCKNSHGPKIHQARIKCLENEHVPQRTDVTSDEMQEELNQEAPHSSQSLCVPLTIPPSLLPQPKVQRSLQPPIP